jgi:hypothetical protein
MIAQMNPEMDSTAFLWIFSAAGFGFVGAATMFKSKGAHTNIVHYVGAVIGMIFGLLGLALQFDLGFSYILAHQSLYS